MTTSSTDGLHDELSAHLGSLGDAPASSAGAYRVERVLKESPSEVTQLAWLREEGGGELGPFVRKLIVAGAGLGGAYRELFEAERSGRHFRHLPRLLDVREEAGWLVVVMEYIPGATLGEVIRATDPAQRPVLAARLIPVICDAVSELHEAFDSPIIHRDLTPANIVCPEGDPTSPILIDLGIARSWREDATSDTTHFGTRAYAPPEQFGFGQTDVRSDVYALGMLALFCLLGRDPLPDDRNRGFALPGVPEPWRAVVSRACALDPAERHATARELGQALRLAGGPQVLPVAEATLSAETTVRAGTDRPDSARPKPERPTTHASSDRPVVPDARHLLARATNAQVSLVGCQQESNATGTGGSALPPRGVPHTLRCRVLALFSRVPGWVGLVWNLCLFALAVLVAAGCLFAITDPNEHDRTLPQWFLVFQYGVFLPVFVLPYLYAFCDRRWLRRRIPALGRVSVLRETAACLGIMVLAVVAYLGVIAISGVTLVSAQ